MLRKTASGVIFTVLMFTMLILAFDVRSVKAQQTVTIETKLFSYSIFVPEREIRAPNIQLTGGTPVRITFNASETIDFFCQNSWEYSQSSDSGWTIIYSHWSDKTAHMNRTYTIPTTDTWYFTLVNYEYHGIDVYNITLYSLEVYEIYLESDKNFYSKGEQVTLTANVNKNGEAISGNDVVLQISDPQGDVIFNQSKQTDAHGQATANFTLPSEEGTYTATAQTIVAGKAIEDTITFAIDETPPTTLHDYDGLWRNADFTITLTATDNESGVAETYYRINDGPVKAVSVDGQPYITTESANNTLEYWSVDNAGNEELPHKTLTGIRLDKTAPTVEIPSRIPENDVEPDQEVKVLVNVTDFFSAVKNVTLPYNLNNSAIWVDLPMSPNSTTGLYEAIIPGQQIDTIVKYRITAYDNAGNYRVEDNSGQYFVYTVIPEFLSFLILPLFMIATLLAVIVYRRKHSCDCNRVEYSGGVFTA